MELLWYKFGMLIGILGSSVVLAFLPFMLKKIDPSLKRRLMSYGNAFAGGVFLAIGFTHLLSEATELTSHAFEDMEFPLSYVLSMAGFILVFFIEKVLFADNHSHHMKLDDDEKPKTTSISAQQNKYGTLDVDVEVEAVSHEHYVSESGVFAYILTLVLSIHSLISGIALGMTESLATLIPLFVGIIGHKWIEAFALGVALNKANDSLAKNWKLLVLYSAMEPLGIVIGEILSLYLPEDALSVTQALVLAVASGTFIYVAVMDIIPAEFGENNTEDKYKKFAIFSIGIVAVTLLMLPFSHSHGHEDSHSHDHDHDH